MSVAEAEAEAEAEAAVAVAVGHPGAAAGIQRGGWMTRQRWTRQCHCQASLSEGAVGM